MADPLRIVFAGTPAFAVPALDTVLASPNAVAAVYTQPDRPAGRGRRLAAPAVKRRALEAGCDVRQPLSLQEPSEQSRLAGLKPDLMIVVAYGLILPRAVLDIPRLGCWNLHASLLPRWRGAAPIQRAILAGDTETGVCLMRMVAELDAGAVVSCERTPIGDGETAGELHDRLAALGAGLLGHELSRAPAEWADRARPQDEAGVTYAAKIGPDEAALDWLDTAEELARQVRAFNPVPGARAELAGEPVKVWRARAVEGTADPGAPVTGPDQIAVGTGHGLLELLEVQRPGKRRVSGADYLNARRDLADRST